MAVKYVTRKQMNHPLELTEKDCERIEAVLAGNLDYKWISDGEIEAYQDLLYDYIAAEKQTVEGVLTLQ